MSFATGTYACPPPVVDQLATTASPMIVRAIDGPRTAKFDRGGAGDFYFSHVRAVILDGVEIANASGHGVQLDSGVPFVSGDLSSDFVLMSSYVHDTQLAGIKVAQSQRIYVIGNEFAHIGATRQCAEFVGSDMPVIVGNDAHDADAFDEVKGGAHGGIIARNEIHDMNPGGGGILVGGDCTGQQYLVDTSADFEAENLVVWSNVVTGTNGFAFRVVGCHDCTIANNTYGAPAPTAIVRVIHDSFGSTSTGNCDIPLHNANVRVTNNLFAWSKTSLDVIPTDEERHVRSQRVVRRRRRRDGALQRHPVHRRADVALQRRSDVELAAGRCLARRGEPRKRRRIGDRRRRGDVRRKVPRGAPGHWGLLIQPSID